MLTCSLPIYTTTTIYLYKNVQYVQGPYRKIYKSYTTYLGEHEQCIFFDQKTLFELVLTSCSGTRVFLLRVSSPPPAITHPSAQPEASR